jgi:hypothetical protein
MIKNLKLALESVHPRIALASNGDFRQVFCQIGADTWAKVQPLPLE